MSRKSTTPVTTTVVDPVVDPVTDPVATTPDPQEPADLAAAPVTPPEGDGTIPNAVQVGDEFDGVKVVAFDPARMVITIQAPPDTCFDATGDVGAGDGPTLYDLPLGAAQSRKDKWDARQRGE